MLQLELEIDKEVIFKQVPKIQKGIDREPIKVDTTVNSKVLLCPVHLEKLIAVIDRQGDKAPMSTILEGKPKLRDGIVVTESGN